MYLSISWILFFLDCFFFLILIVFIFVFYFFWFIFSPETKNDPFQLNLEDEDSLEKAPFLSGLPVKMLIHGYTGHRNFSPNTEIRPGKLNKLKGKRIPSTQWRRFCLNFFSIYILHGFNSEIDYRKLSFFEWWLPF